TAGSSTANHRRSTMSSNAQWYMAIGGQQVGPVTEEEIVSNIKNGSVDASTLVFVAGMDNWTALKGVPKVQAHLGPAPRPAAPPPPSPPAGGGGFAAAGGRQSHEISYTIHGAEMQFVEVELDPGEAAIGEAGTMMYMTPGIDMDTIFGDGSVQ